MTKDRINCVFELPQTQANYNLLTLFQFPIAPTTFVDCELSLGNAVAHSGACFVPYGAPTRFNMHFDGPADVLPPIQFSCALAPCCVMCRALCASFSIAAARLMRCRAPVQRACPTLPYPCSATHERYHLHGIPIRNACRLFPPCAMPHPATVCGCHACARKLLSLNRQLSSGMWACDPFN